MYTSSEDRILTYQAKQVAEKYVNNSLPLVSKLKDSAKNYYEYFKEELDQFETEENIFYRFVLNMSNTNQILQDDVLCFLEQVAKINNRELRKEVLKIICCNKNITYLLASNDRIFSKIAELTK